VRRVAEALGAPVVAGYSGRGVLSDRHPLSFTIPYGHRLWPKVDVLLAIGTRAFAPQSQWGLDDAVKVVRIDIDPTELARVRPPAVGIVADAREGLETLLAALARAGRAAPPRDAELAAVRAEVAAEIARFTPQVEYLAALREALPEDGFLVDDLTQVGYVARIAFPVWRPRQLVNSAWQGTLGYGFAAALGVKLANPDKAVVSINGDGGFLYNVQELATAVLHHIPVVAVVFNDDAFGNVKRMQEDDYGGRVIASELKNPDFPRLAETFGAVGARATSPEAMAREIRLGLARAAPTLIEVPIGKVPDPWHLIHMRRIRPARPRAGS
jgi:acetolactate synthase-1/2/3 large subunit